MSASVSEISFLAQERVRMFILGVCDGIWPGTVPDVCVDHGDRGGGGGRFWAGQMPGGRGLGEGDMGSVMRDENWSETMRPNG